MDKKTKIVIAGGGTSGWLTASALAIQMGEVFDITLVESSDIGSVGVGEATIPPMKTFHKLLGIDERQFMRATNATFKLGIEFENWKAVGEKYFHSFGETGNGTLITEFIHFWMRGRELGVANEFGHYCMEYQAALRHRVGDLQQITLNHAFHFDASLYAKFLKKLATDRGVNYIDGNISHVAQDHTNGFITELQLVSGDKVKGDFFIDCTGFKALLIEQILNCGFEDWSHWLPCDRAIAIQTESNGDTPPYTRSIAHQAGWQWRIPLQNRVGNGIVYSSRYMSDDDAQTQLMATISGQALTESNVIKFRTGRRRKSWHKNCLAIGLAAGFLEPLESTSIHLIMTAITRLLQMGEVRNAPQSMVDEYNQQTAIEMEHIRDFIILHYKQTERQDSEFWRFCKNMDIPNQLAHRIALFQKTGKSYQTEGELFRLDSWTQVMLGQGLTPEQYHPIAKTFKNEQLTQFLAKLELDVSKKVSSMSSHQSFLNIYCKH